MPVQMTPNHSFIQLIAKQPIPPTAKKPVSPSKKFFNPKMKLLCRKWTLAALVLLQIASLITFVAAGGDDNVEEGIVAPPAAEHGQSSGAAASSPKDPHSAVHAVANHTKLRLNSEDVVKFVDCFMKYVYESLMPKFNPAIRKALKTTPEEKNEQFDYFMAANYAIHDHMKECVKGNQNLINLLDRILLKTGFESSIEERKQYCKAEFNDIGNKGKVVDANDGKVVFDGEKFGPKQLKYWRRMPVASGLALRHVYYVVLKHLVVELAKAPGIQGSKKNPRQMNAAKQSLISMKWLADRMDSQVETDAKIIQYTYVKSYLNFVDYTNHIKQIKENLQQSVSVITKGNLNFALPKVRRVIWAVREIKYWKFASKLLENEDEQNEADAREKKMEELLAKALSHLPISRIFVGEIGTKTDGKTPKDGSPSVQTAQALLDRNVFPKVKEIEGVLKGLNSDFYLGDTGTTGDDHSCPGIMEALGNVLHAAPTVTDAKQQKPNELLAPGEENAEHVLLIGDVGSMISLQSIVTGTYKYIMMDSISKYVEVDKPKNPGQSILRMVFSSEIGHLEKLFGDTEKENKAREKFFQT